MPSRSGFPGRCKNLKSFKSGTLGSTVRSTEPDAKVLLRRQKQINYGKATNGYYNYINFVPKARRTVREPKTPNKFQMCSRRSFDGQIKFWRKSLQSWDVNENMERKNTDSDKTESYDGSFTSAEDDTDDSDSSKQLTPKIELHL